MSKPGASPRTGWRTAPVRRFLATVGAGAAASLIFAAGGLAAPPPPPSDLQVQGGEEAWHPQREFYLAWKFPPAVTAIHCRVSDRWGAIVVPERTVKANESINPIVVPATPGDYQAEVWLENAAGEQGAPAQAWLHFDDVRPAAVEPQPAATWVGRTGFPLAIRLPLAAGPVPVSGIRGFAVSVGRSPAGEPCAAADRCLEAETNVFGKGNDAFSIIDLPEGTNYLRAVAVSGAGLRSRGTGSASIRVDKTDPAVSLSGAPAGWSNRPLRLVATASDGGSGMRPGDGGMTPFTAIRVDGERPVTAIGDSVSTSLATEGAHRVDYYARDLAGNVADGSVIGGVRQPDPRTAAVRIDRTPPRVAFANAQDPLEPELIRARVEDELSGPDRSSGWIGIRRAGSGDAFARLPAAAGPGGELRARWDSDSYPPGAYEFEATGRDRAGNAAASSRRVDGAPMVLSNPLKAVTAVSAGFGGGSPTRRTVPYGRRVLLSGHLRDAAGSPLGESRPVQVIESFAGGGPASIATVWADASGAFAYRLPPGPSRRVRVVFAGSPTLARSGSGPLDLRVRSVVRLRASAWTARVGGAPIVFRGAVEAAPGAIPAAGRTVELQFRLPGLPWSEFRTVQTNRRGRFRYAYRFSDDDSRGARFLFRACAPAQAGWPYEPARSLPVPIRGI